MALKEEFDKIDLLNTAIVARQTWGHLAPQPGTVHALTLLFCCGEYGHIVPIRVESITLDDSPWFYDDMQTFIETNAKEAGRIYKFDGTYRKYKNGNCKFTGTTKIVM